MGTINKTTAQIDLLLDGVFGEIHVHDNAIAQSISAGATYNKLTAFDENGVSRNMTPDQANNEIQVDNDGDYKISGAFSYASGTQNVTYFLGIFLNGVEQDQIHWTRKVGTAGDVGSSSCHGIITATAGQKIDVRVRHDNGAAVNYTLSYGNLNALMVGVN